MEKPRSLARAGAVECTMTQSLEAKWEFGFYVQGLR